MDLFGVSRGKVLPAKSDAEFLANGLGFHASECQCDPAELSAEMNNGVIITSQHENVGWCNYRVSSRGRLNDKLSDT